MNNFRLLNIFNDKLIIIACFMFCDVSVIFASNKTELVLNYKDGKCQLFYWKVKNEEKIRVLMNAKPYKVNAEGKVYCSIKFPVSEYDNNFKFCSISGLSNYSDNFSFSVSHFGGSEHPNNLYYFEWKDAKYVKPRYICINN